MSADLAVDTAVTPLAREPGAYRCMLPDHWDYFAPCGGVLMTVALRAIEREIGDSEQQPLSATTIFCSPLRPGPLVARVTLLRRGNVATQARCSLSHEGEGVGLEVSATFARGREGPSFMGATRPDVQTAAQLIARKPDHVAVIASRFRFEQNVDVVPAPAGSWPSGEAHALRYFRYRVPQRLADGSLDPLALPPIADTMPVAVHHGIGRGHRVHMPSIDLTVHFLARASTEWLLVHSRSRMASAGYATAEAELWGDDGTLVAWANQTMILRRLPPP